MLTVGSLQFQEQVIVIQSGQLFQLRLNWLNQRVKYHSENTVVASVNSAGKILGLKPGNTVVTATSKEKTAKSKIYVISFDETVALKKGDTKRIQVKGKLTNISYQSENTRIAKVSLFGKVTGISKGSTDIIIKIHGYSFRVKVTVK